MKKILTFASTFPSSIHPIHGVFVKERVKHLSMKSDCDIRVISPVPYFPPLKISERWYSFFQIKKVETIDGLVVSRPRYLLLPKIGSFMHSYSMASFSRPVITKLQNEFQFRIIDSHFVYPDGVAAAILKKKYNQPLVITGRGEDILSFPDYPVIGNQIRWALKQADALIALSNEIGDAMVKNGASEGKISVIPNGVDNQKFDVFDRNESRKRLNLPENKRIILSVGSRLERKGFHILIEAMPRICEQFPDSLLVIVGGVARHGHDFTAVIKKAIAQNNLEESVLLFGAQPPEELKFWYSAADVFALMTSREGSPNVVMEALSCGLPVVATPIGGIPEILENPELGILLNNRSAEQAEYGIIKAFETDWDYNTIRNYACENSWHRVADKVNDVFSAISNRF